MGFLDGLFGRNKNKQQEKVASVPVPDSGPRGSTSSSVSLAPAAKLEIFNKLQMLEERKTMIDKRIAELDRQVEADLIEAKALLGKGQKLRAEVVLKRKKIKETERQNKLNFLVSMERQIEEIKAMMGQVEDMKAMESMRDLSQNIMKQVDPEKLISMQEEMEEQKDKMREVQDLLYAAPVSEYDAEVEADMAALMGELQEEAKQALNMPEPSKAPLPATPEPAAPLKAGPGPNRLSTPMGVYTTEKKSKVDQEAEDELARLQAEMGLTN